MIKLQPILVGYIPKRTAKRPDWLQAAGVEEICSASCCCSESPDDMGTPNDFGIYDSPEEAMALIEGGHKHEYDLYAYSMFPVIFREGLQDSFEIATHQVTPLTDSFEFLGFDVVSRSCGFCFECSPLSCNNMAEHIAVNRHCLLDNIETAIENAANFEAQQCEPGPYHVLGIWRRKRGSLLQT